MKYTVTTFVSHIPKDLFLFLIGGIAYILVEFLFRGYSHPSMFLLGGLCFWLIGEINEAYPWDMPMVSQMFISMIIITCLEFIFGIILNVILKLGVWDYTGLPYNIFGQVSLIFSIAWFFLSAVAIIVDDHIRFIFYNEDLPHYDIFYHNPYGKKPKRRRIHLC